MPGHRLGRAYRQFIGVIAESPFDCNSFQLIAQIGRSTMSVYIAHLRGLDFGVIEGIQHDPVGAVAVLRWLGDVISIAAHAIARYFGKDLGPTAASELKFFQDQYSRALTDDEAIPG